MIERWFSRIVIVLAAEGWWALFDLAIKKPFTWSEAAYALALCGVGMLAATADRSLMPWIRARVRFRIYPRRFFFGLVLGFAVAVYATIEWWRQ